MDKKETNSLTICEYFFAAYQEFKCSKQAACIVNCEPGTYDFVRVWAQNFAYVYDYQFLQNGVSRTTIRNAVKGKFLIHKEYSNWRARHLGQTDEYHLSLKGIKALYNAFKGQW